MLLFAGTGKDEVGAWRLTCGVQDNQIEQIGEGTLCQHSHSQAHSWLWPKIHLVEVTAQQECMIL